MSTPATTPSSRRGQIMQTYQMAKRSDPRIGLIVMGVFVLGAALGFALMWVLPGDGMIGWIVSRHPTPDRLLTDRFAAECRVPAHQHGGSRTGESLSLFAREAGVIMPALFIGSLVAGAIQSFVPRQVLVTLGSDPVFSILALMALAFVISVCSNVDAFFILPFASTFLPGSIVAFLVFGPVIDIKMLSLMRTTYKARTLVLITALVGLLSLLIGLVVNLIA